VTRSAAWYRSSSTTPRGVATQDNAKTATAKKDLAGYITQFSAFVSSATKLPKSALAADLQGRVSTLETAINSIAAGSPKASANLLVAEDHIASSMPSRFST
jgi:hypothetical protein